MKLSRRKLFGLGAGAVAAGIFSKYLSLKSAVAAIPRFNRFKMPKTVRLTGFWVRTGEHSYECNLITPVTVSADDQIILEMTNEISEDMKILVNKEVVPIKVRPQKRTPRIWGL